MDPLPLNIRHIATIAGVSSSTVSRALRNDPQVSPKTCQRLQKLAAELGYKPNPMVSTLMANRVRLRKSTGQQIIAFLHAYPKKDEWKRFSTWVDYFNGAQKRAAEYGYSLEEFWLRAPRMNSKKMSHLLFHRGIHGVLLSPAARGMGHSSLEWGRFSTAALGYSIIRPFVHRAVHDNVSAIRMALRHLQRLGYQRIALVVNRVQDKRSNAAWSAGFGEYSLFRRDRDRVSPYLFSDYSVYDLKFQRWLDQERPDAIIAGSPYILDWMKDAGLNAPKDFGFVLLDRPLDGSSCSGIYLNGPAIGAAAIDLIIGQINRNERGLPEIPKTTMIKGQWIPGKTLRPARVTQ